LGGSTRKLWIIYPLTKRQKYAHAIESVGASIKFLSFYSPDFNSIENCWSKLTEYLRSQEAHTCEQLDQAIAQAVNLVTDQNIIGWFTHCCYYVPSN
jgi:transposase